jgi:hypothetical protein
MSRAAAHPSAPACRPRLASIQRFKYTRTQFLNTSAGVLDAHSTIHVQVDNITAQHPTAPAPDPVAEGAEALLLLPFSVPEDP